MTDPDPKLIAALPTGRDTVPISRARRHLAGALVEGTTCPVCGQHARLYRRKIHATMANQLVDAYNTVGTAEFHAPTLGISGGDFAKLAHWGLIAERTGRRQDGGRAGWWRITRDGERFLHGEARVPEFVLIYDGERIGFDGDTVGLTTVLGDGFDLRDTQAADAGDADRAPVDVLPPEAPGTPPPHPATDGVGEAPILNTPPTHDVDTVPVVDLEDDDDVADGRAIAESDAIIAEHGAGPAADAIIAGEATS